MNPRLKTSKKWTAFPADYVSQITQVFQDVFGKHLNKAKLVVEGRIYSEEVLLRVGFLEKGRLKQNNFEVSMNYNFEKQDAVERIHDSIDAAAALMTEFFEASEEDELDLPRIWKEIDFGKKKIYVQYSTVNTDLEAQGDALLGMDEESLVKGDDEDDSENDDDGPAMKARSNLH